jgi:hypothetical protein
MKASELLTLFKEFGKRAHLIGDLDAGAIVALDVEGRWYATLDGEILNRVNPDAICGQSTRAEYLNPGGDGLWPAPEGTALGYEYSTGNWRVPPGLTSARYLVTQSANESVTVCAEIDLINSQGLGIPLLFQRQLAVESEKGSLLVKAKETITYLGTKRLGRDQCLLAPWTLCQFDSGPGRSSFRAKRKDPFGTFTNRAIHSESGTVSFVRREPMAVKFIKLRLTKRSRGSSSAIRVVA